MDRLKPDYIEPHHVFSSTSTDAIESESARSRSDRVIKLPGHLHDWSFNQVILPVCTCATLCLCSTGYLWDTLKMGSPFLRHAIHYISNRWSLYCHEQPMSVNQLKHYTWYSETDIRLFMLSASGKTFARCKGIRNFEDQATLVFRHQLCFGSFIFGQPP
jgi:hypothetical protein